MKVLGIDPGTHRLGWALVEGTPHNQRAVKHGCLDLPPKAARSLYLPRIHTLLATLLKAHAPAAVGLETLLFQTNVKTALTVAEARGVVELAAAQASVPVVELAPNTIKSCVAGHGGASKQEVAHMVGLLLREDVSTLVDDEVDALAIAMTTIIICKLKIVKL